MEEIEDRDSVLTPRCSAPSAALRAQVTARKIAAQLYAGGMRCNCDLDNWQPERSTGHTSVCRIHKSALDAFLNQPRGLSAAEAPISAESVNTKSTDDEVRK